MNGQTIKIGIVAPGGPLKKEAADRVLALSEELFPDTPPKLLFHGQCFESCGHFAGSDDVRAAALLEYANDPTINAIWFARGGYGAARILDQIIPNLSDTARQKSYLGYSDAGSLLGALYNAGIGAGIGRLAHGPMPTDINRSGGEHAVSRALSYLVEGNSKTIEPAASSNQQCAAFNLTILSHLIGTPHMPDLSGHVLMLEEVSEHMYRIDRSLCHITSNREIRKIAGLRMGRCTDVPENEPAFGQTAEEVAQHWCAVSGIPYLGTADIGHDIDNKVVPFGTIVTS